MPDNEKQAENTSPNQPKIHGSSSLDKSSGSSGPSTPHHDPDHSRNDCHLLKRDPLLTYGELVILGYNGTLPQGEKGRRRSKFVLCKRPVSNGVKKSQHYVVKTPQSSKAILDSKQHSISYTLSRNQAVIVEYMPDDETDMFQIGRSSESPIDFVVMDTVPGDKTGEGKVSQSTISRFACRILIHRSPTYTARVYAAGFDSSRNIFLGIDDDTNILQDGTLIDLCGATLLWRSAEGLTKSPTKHLLEEKVDELNAGRPQCPVGLNTLVIPRKSTLTSSDKQPYVYLICGHVQGLHDWRQDKDSPNSRQCPMCLLIGPVVKLTMGIEPSFYVDCGPPNFAFNPCGHMATEKTVKYWASVPIPHGTNGFHAACPFCATPLSGSPGYARLIFQDHVD
ncbi:protein pellino isoform X2 [Parasteatoda tepidariorum]|uniref:protein pellino isoform X2 n=1 Tax=Parasteatoda tepidariorum TaxID=114398 RepID=UPI001C7226C8|nr:protein pellino isoform X2 [Parasteatoda tepidariorum]